MMENIKYDDDELLTVAPVVPKENDLGSGAIRPDIFNRNDAPMEETELQLVVELMGSAESGAPRAGVDIVTVLDVSASMRGIKLKKLKASMKFLVKKLSPIDRLSIIKFSAEAERLCKLTAMHSDGQDEVELIIDQLSLEGGTNITPGLQEALSVLAQRRQSDGRTSAVMLMSDGVLTRGCPQPSTLDLSAVPVYTFGLGRDHDSQLLQDIARSSKQGTYAVADVQGSGPESSASLNIAFASCLAGLLSVVVQDLELTVTSQKDSEIQEVRAGNYDQTRVDKSVKVWFGNLYNREKRNTTVFLSLPAVTKRMTSEVLEIAYSYRPAGGGKVNEASPIFASVTRTTPTTSEDPVEVTNEIARGDTVAAIRKAREEADAKKFDEATKTLKKAEESLNKLNPEANEFIKALRNEVQEFLRLLKDPTTYEKEGRAFALSAELSHGLQRFAARGQDARQLLSLAIPLATLYSNQAVDFDRNMNIPVRSSAQDQAELDKMTQLTDAERQQKAEAAKKEREFIADQVKQLNKIDEDRQKKEAARKNNPLVSQADKINQNRNQAIDSLKAIQVLIAALQAST